MNTMKINGYQAVISFDPDIQMFRGEFLGLNSGANFECNDWLRLVDEWPLTATTGRSPFLQTGHLKGCFTLKSAG